MAEPRPRAAPPCGLGAPDARPAAGGPAEGLAASPWMLLERRAPPSSQAAASLGDVAAAPSRAEDWELCDISSVASSWQDVDELVDDGYRSGAASEVSTDCAEKPTVDLEESSAAVAEAGTAAAAKFDKFAGDLTWAARVRASLAEGAERGCGTVQQGARAPPAYRKAKKLAAESKVGTEAKVAGDGVGAQQNETVWNPPPRRRRK